MAAPKAQKAPNRQTSLATQPVPRSPPSEAAVNGKKKKKKKGKARGADPNLPANPNFADDDDDLPQLEPVTSPPPNPGSPRSIHRTGLSPELESVHLSTTASLSASAAAAARLNATAAAQAELLATANDLYRRMDTESMPDDDDYWASLPSHIKNFVKMTYSQSTNPNVNQNERTKAQSMFAIAQQMIESGAGRMSPKGGQTQPPGAYPSTLPFDPAIFSDPAFSLAMEQTLAASGPLPPAPGQPPRGPLPPTNVVLLNEFGGGEDGQAMEDDYYSEDEVDDNVDDPEMEGDITNSATFVGYDSGMFAPPAHQGGEGEAGKKKSKKKKKKGAVQPVPLSNPPPVAVPPIPNPTPPTPLPAPTVPMPASRPPPATPTHATPLTSSRAAGKQPMSYTAPAPAAAPPTTRTSRAASKAPLPAHAYSHAHHHPSPPSSQTSNKTRPPAAPPKNSKLWSTNSTEERERIKEFWLGLGEEERRALVKVEKEAVLKKMKEQQKHSCSCAVCGRKRCVKFLPIFVSPSACHFIRSLSCADVCACAYCIGIEICDGVI
jgi:Salt tolerance down-regulator